MICQAPGGSGTYAVYRIHIVTNIGKVTNNYIPN